MPAIKHQVTVKATADKIYGLLDTINGLQQWLTKEEGWIISGDETIGGILHFELGKKGFHEMTILKLELNKQVEWQCTTGHPEWLDTTVDFRMDNKQTDCILYFGHNGWAEKTPFFNECDKAWNFYVTNIKRLAEGDTMLTASK